MNLAQLEQNKTVLGTLKYTIQIYKNGNRWSAAIANHARDSGRVSGRHVTPAVAAADAMWMARVPGMESPSV